MDLERLPAAIIIIICFLLAALGLWYASIRFDKPGLKKVAVVVGGFPVLGFGLQIAAYIFDWGAPTDNFHSSVTGPAHVEKEAVREFPMYFSNPGIPHLLELTPEAYFGEQARGEVTLEVELRTPKGEVVTEGKATLGPAKGEYWSTATMQIEPPVEGSYKMKMVIPNPVGQVKYRMTEVKKK